MKKIIAKYGAAIILVSLCLFPNYLFAQENANKNVIDQIVCEVIGCVDDSALRPTHKKSGSLKQQRYVEKKPFQPNKPIMEDREDSEELNGELSQLFEKHEREMRMLNQELDKELKESEQEFRKEARQEEKPEKIMKLRSKFERKVEKAYSKFQQKVEKEDSKYEKKRNRLIEKSSKKDKSDKE